MLAPYAEKGGTTGLAIGIAQENTGLGRNGEWHRISPTLRLDRADMGRSMLRPYAEKDGATLKTRWLKF